MTIDGAARIRLLAAILLALLAAAPSVGKEPRGEALTAWRDTGTQSPGLPGAPLSEAERETVAGIERYFAATDAETRQRIAASLAARPVDPLRVRVMLHAARLHEKIQTGTTTLRFDTLEDKARPVELRVPRKYDPRKPWPVILAYHPTGADGRAMIGALERVLGNRIDQFVVAAPADYQPLNVDSRRSWKSEFRSILQQIRHLVHVDSDRVYAVGYSQGGYATWSAATFYTDELAGAAAIACTYDAAPEIPGLWETLLPNVAPLPVLHVWGSKDAFPVPGFDLTTVVAEIAGANERLVALSKTLNLDVLLYRIDGGGHAFEPPADRLNSLLERRRVLPPATVRTRFRYVVQGRAWWLEPLTWNGDAWGVKPRSIDEKPGETPRQAIGRVLGELLGGLDGEIQGQRIRVSRRHVGDLVIWLHDTAIDWNRPVTVDVDGKTVFEGRIGRDLAVCLAQAARTRDFDRLRWAGILVSKDGSARILTGADELPTVVAPAPE